jgi:PAS domain-containing protein
MRNSIRTRLTITFIGVATGPLLLVGIVLAWQSFAVQRQQALSFQRQVAQRVAIQVTALFQKLEDELRLVSQVQGLHGLDRDQQRALLSRQLAYQDVSEELVLLDGQGQEQIVLSRLGLTPSTLRENEERLRMALEGTTDGMWDWNLATGQTYFSPGYYTMLGYEPDEFPPTDESWRQLIHPDDVERIKGRAARPGGTDPICRRISIQGQERGMALDAGAGQGG